MSSNQRNAVILVVVLVALAGAIAYNVRLSRQRALQPRRVTIFDRTATWRCLACGHTLSDLGGNGPRTCPECGSEAMYVVEEWACPTHGRMIIALEYDEAGKPSRVKVGDGEWVSALDEEGDVSLRCPRCGDSLVLPQALPPG